MGLHLRIRYAGCWWWCHPIDLSVAVALIIRRMDGRVIYKRLAARHKNKSLYLFIRLNLNNWQNRDTWVVTPFDMVMWCCSVSFPIINIIKSKGDRVVLVFNLKCSYIWTGKCIRTDGWWAAPDLYLVLVPSATGLFSSLFMFPIEGLRIIRIGDWHVHYAIIIVC